MCLNIFWLCKFWNNIFEKKRLGRGTASDVETTLGLSLEDWWRCRFRVCPFFQTPILLVLVNPTAIKYAWQRPSYVNTKWAFFPSKNALFSILASRSYTGSVNLMTWKLLDLENSFLEKNWGTVAPFCHLVRRKSPRLNTSFSLFIRFSGYQIGQDKKEAGFFLQTRDGKKHHCSFECHCDTLRRARTSNPVPCTFYATFSLFFCRASLH